jgi:hypothetical protein
MRRIVLSAVIMAPMAMPGVAQAQQDLPAPASIEASIGTVDDNPLGTLDLFIPLLGGGDNLWFADLRASFGGDQKVTQGSIGTGYRVRYDDVWTLGANAYFDYLHSDHDNDFGQLGFGLEALSRDWEVRANAYLPVGSVDAAVASANAALIEANTLVFRAGEETVMRGFDGEIGYRLPVFAPDDLTQLKAFAGGYWYQGEDVEDVPGVSARLEFSRAGLPALGNGSRFTLIAGVSYDDERDVRGTFLARLRVPLGATGNQAPYDPLYRRVERADAIRTHIGATGKAETAIYVETGHAAGKVVRVGNGDNADEINGALEDAGDGALVLAGGEIAVDSTVQLGTGQFLLGGGAAVEVRGASSGGTAVFRSRAPAATITGTDPDADVIGLGDQSAVAGLAIRGGRDGIAGSGVDGIVVREVDIAGTSSDGIQLFDVESATITASRIHDLTICGIEDEECSFKYDEPDTIRHAAISAVGVKDLIIRDVAIENVTFGLFVANDFDTDDWESPTLIQSERVSVENVSITNSYREGITLVGVQDMNLRNVTVDNSALERSMDLVVMLSVADLSIDGMALKGGANGLMFGPPSVGEVNTRIDVANVFIDNPLNAGVFMNPSTHVSFTNVTIRDGGYSGGFFLYGDSSGFFGGPISDVSFDNVRVEGGNAAAVNILGPIENFSGNIVTSNAPSRCSAPFGSLTQDAGSSFSIDGLVVAPGDPLPSDCGI